MVERPASVSTDNTGINGKDNPVKIELEITITVPENLSEAAEFYGGEEKLIEVIQAETQRRKINAARAALRDVENGDLDFAAFATNVAEQYTPGRRGGFQSPTVDSDELAGVAGDMDALLSLLAAKGIQVT